MILLAASKFKEKEERKRYNAVLPPASKFAREKKEKHTIYSDDYVKYMNGIFKN